MVQDAEEHAAEDKSKREEVEQRNRLDKLVFDVEKDSKEWADRLDESHKKRLDEAVESAKKALRSGAADEIKQALEELSQAFSAAGASLYQEAQAQSAESTGGAEAGAEAESGKEEEVVEADYEIVDDSK
jgi:molecular chaperone DnaK